MSSRSSRSRSRSRSRSPRRRVVLTEAQEKLARREALYTDRPETARNAIVVLLVTVFAVCVYVVVNHGAGAFARVGHDLSQSPVVSRKVLGAVRMTCLAAVLVTLAVMFADTTPFVFRHRAESPAEGKVALLGLARMSTFTPWAFTTIGVYFALTSALSLGLTDSPIISTAAAVLYEIAFPLALLVSSIVTYVLYPMAVLDRRVQKFVIARQFMFGAQMMHNGNILMMTIETLLFHHKPELWFCVLPVMVGCLYVALAWWWFSRTRVFYYWFMDYHWRYSPVAYVLVLCVLVAFSLLTMLWRAAVFDWQLSPWIVYPASLVLALLVCRFRDSKKPTKKTAE